MWMSVDYVAVAEGVLKGYRDNGLSLFIDMVSNHSIKIDIDI